MSNKTDYWNKNISLIIKLLIVWFLISLGAGVIFVDQLDHVRLFGYPLGFWFAEQGSIFGFIGIVVYYTYKMNRLDKEYGVSED